MPRGSPFTSLCTRLAGLRSRRLADLHVHTTASDGDFTPSQVVAFARQAGLSAVAVTDHDTLAGVAEAEAFARSSPGTEVVAGVEITTSFGGRELHLLGYFVRADHPELAATLARLCDRRRDRFRDFVAKLAGAGHVIPEDRARLVGERSASLGRRHVAGLLLACGFARTRNEAFGRFLGPLAGKVLPKVLLPFPEAVALVHAAGGATSLAHPPADLGDDDFREFRECGLDGLEAEYPWGRSSPGGKLREAAARFGFLVTGGSDCHGPDPAHRRVGSHGITSEELEWLRGRRGGVGRAAAAGS